MSHKRRLDAIEEQVADSGRRCPQCADWPAHRIDWPAGHEYAADPAPAKCESCGFEPVTIAVRYVEDWKAARLG